MWGFYNMGNQLAKDYNIQEKPIKLPGSYSFLGYLNHPAMDQFALILVKHPHKAAPLPSTIVLPIRQIRSISDDTLAICPPCLPLCLVKPACDTEMKILMHQLVALGVQLGRCFLCDGRVVLWSEERRSMTSISPQEVSGGKCSEKSRVFISGMALINFLVGLDEKQQITKLTKKKESQKKTTEVKLFFEPHEKKQFIEQISNLEWRLKGTEFWKNIPKSLESLLMSMIQSDPDIRIDLQTVLKHSCFYSSLQVRFYNGLVHDVESMPPKEAKIFMKSLEIIINEGLTFENVIMQKYFIPVLASLASRIAVGEKAYLLPFVLSALIETHCPPAEIIIQAFKSVENRSVQLMMLGLQKRERLYKILPSEAFEFILSRSLFYGLESPAVVEIAVSAIPFAMRVFKQPNLKREIEFLLISKVLTAPSSPEILLNGLKCMIFLLKEELASPSKLSAMLFNPITLTLQANLHVLYMYGHMVEQLKPSELIHHMMPKLEPYLCDPEVTNELFIVGNKCVSRMMQRLYQQRKLATSEKFTLEKGELFFEMQSDPRKLRSNEKQKEQMRTAIQKHSINNLEWIIHMW